jgi:hypothetical protein
MSGVTQLRIMLFAPVIVLQAGESPMIEGVTQTLIAPYRMMTCLSFHWEETLFRKFIASLASHSDPASSCE